MPQAESNYWAHWEYTFQEWQAFRNAEWQKAKNELTMTIACMLIMIVIALIISVIKFIWGMDTFIIVMVFIGLLLSSLFVVWAFCEFEEERLKRKARKGEEYISELYIATTGVYLDADLTQPYEHHPIMDQALYNEHLSVAVYIEKRFMYVEIMGNESEPDESPDWSTIIRFPIPTDRENEAEQIGIKYQELYKRIEPSWEEE